MEESREIQKLHGFLQCTIYLMVIAEIMIFVYSRAPFLGLFSFVVDKLSLIPIYHKLLYSKFATLVLICLVSIGTLSKKKIDLDPKMHIMLPLTAGLLMFFGSLWLYCRPSGIAFSYTSWYNLFYIICSLFGALTLSISMDNISKMIRSGLGKDKWNVDQESFMQPTEKVETSSSVNIPMQFYHKGKVRDGWINLNNIFRSCMVIGTPGSGKSFSLINPIIRQLMAKELCLCVFDFKYPDLGKILYYHFLLAKQQDKCRNYTFHVINPTEPENSRRINLFRREWLGTLADASETAEALVEAMKKGDKSGGSDQFFTQSAINFLASCIFFFSKYQDGKFSTFPHVMAFLNRSYDEIFKVLFTEPELVSLLSPFRSAYQLKAFDQLEGQIGTLKIFMSRLATKETFWVFSGDDFNLKISDPNEPGVLVLASNPNTQNITSACFTGIVNRMTRLMNSRGNLPCGLIVDEAPTLYCHKIENVISTARSMKFAVVLGLQELPMLQQQYGKDTAAVITSVVGNILSGSVRNKDTLDWLERLFGKSKQISENLSIDRNKTSTSLNEKMEALIPAGKIASLNTGEMVGLIAAEPQEHYDGKFETSAIHCRINLDTEELKKEEQNYKELPIFYDFGDKKEEILMKNFLKINDDIDQLVQEFMQLNKQ
ncbi:type IV secretion system DNA-binding domain-containing protein [Pedobacter panaciterrae]|uniref:type IV secretion system DNA-binding domain-containing protein n=1 Tax=Pedobacter panaciterrae TaxID=363849 RepID=UPI00155DCE8F|nr:TraM recognition domain-containing protein [Pedobacter panaciterrae]NQX54479.1 type IV secretion system DNA-binding domain-containing protein [Pedobacter panaciterrae]